MEAVLLDTHVVLWYDVAPERLSEIALSTIRNRSNRVFVSAITALEIAIKHRLGKLPEADRLMRHYEASLVRYGFEELPLASPAALRVATLDASHADPFDRVLAAQAIQLRIALVTRDEAFASFSGLATVW